MRRIGSLLFVLLVAANAFASRVVLQRDGAVVEGAEVCRFAAFDRENPFDRWLAATELTCAPADGDITFPPGLWNVFGRVEGKFITVPRLIDGSRAPANLTFSVDPAATLTSTPSSDKRRVFYVPRLAYAIPATERTTVPANEELWLFVIDVPEKEEEAKLEISSLLSIPAVGEGVTRGLEPRRGASSNLIGWIHVPAEHRVLLRKLKVTPKVTGMTETGLIVDGDPVPALRLLNGSFVRVRGLPAGGATLGMGGEGWLAASLGANIEASVTTLRSPLLARPAGSLIVNWSTTKNLYHLNGLIAGCERSKPQGEVFISRCAIPALDQPVELSTCRAGSTVPVDGFRTFGSFAINDLPPGQYVAELRFGFLPPVRGSGVVVAQEQRTLEIRGDYQVLEGTVMRDGKPLGAPTIMKFDGDNGAGASMRLVGYPGGVRRFPPPPPRAGGSPTPTQEQRRKDFDEYVRTWEAAYQAVLRTLPKIDTKIDIASCDRRIDLFALSDLDVEPGKRLDIEVPDNELRIRVVDTFTRAALGGGPVRYTILSKLEPHTPVVNGTLWTEKDPDKLGTLTWRSVPKRKVTLTVSYPGYEKQTVGPFTLDRRERRAMEIQMVPLRGGESKIVSSTPFVNGAVYWFAPDGSETEVAELSPEGAFVYTARHRPDETMAVISESHPLWVTRSRQLDGRRGVEIAFPQMNARELDVLVADDDRTDPHYVGLVIGGVRVSTFALAQHQALRHSPATVGGSNPLRLYAIGETGPIDVYLGPHVAAVPTRWSGIDIFTLPAYADVPRQRLGAESTGVVFEED